MNIRYFAGKGYHTQAVVLLRDGNRVTVDLTSYQTYYKTSRAISGDIEAVALDSVTGGWMGEATYVVDGTTCTVRTQGKLPDCDSVFAVLRADVSNILAAEAALDANPVAKLEMLLESCDWYSHLSDDPAVWPRLDVQMNKIAKVLPHVDAQTAKTLWAKYAPSGITCPV